MLVAALLRGVGYLVGSSELRWMMSWWQFYFMVEGIRVAFLFCSGGCLGGSLNREVRIVGWQFSWGS